MGGFVFDSEHSKGLKLGDEGEKLKFTIFRVTASYLVSTGFRGRFFEWKGLFSTQTTLRGSNKEMGAKKSKFAVIRITASNFVCEGFQDIYFFEKKKKNF